METAWRGCELAEGIFPGPAEGTARVICDLGDIHRGEVPCACQAGQVHGIPAVGLDAVTGFVGKECRGHHPAIGVFFRQLAGEPGATRTCFIEEEEVVGLRWHRAEELINGTLTGAKSAQGGARSAVILGDLRPGHRLCGAIHANDECARLRPGWPPRV